METSLSWAASVELGRFGEGGAWLFDFLRMSCGADGVVAMWVQIKCSLLACPFARANFHEVHVVYQKLLFVQRMVCFAGFVCVVVFFLDVMVFVVTT